MVHTDCDNGLDDTKNTGGEEGCVGACDADGFENSRAVVIDRVDARCVLPEEQRAPKEESIGDFAVVPERLEWLPEPEPDCCMLMF